MQLLLRCCQHQRQQQLHVLLLHFQQQQQQQQQQVRLLQARMPALTALLRTLHLSPAATCRLTSGAE
jgi:hypothetical protein